MLDEPDSDNESVDYDKDPDPFYDEHMDSDDEQWAAKNLPKGTSPQAKSVPPLPF